jgi:hypothetical protein
MRKKLLLFSMFFLLALSSLFSQTLNDYILKTKGDTLVVKDFNDANKHDILNLILTADSVNVPAGRVYQLHNYGYYSIVNTPTSSTKRKVIIAGESNQSVKTRKSAAAPPILCGAVYEGGSSTGGLNSGLDLVLKNANINVGNSGGGEGWAFFGSSANAKITIDNCIFEHTLWTGINPGSNSKIFWKNMYFVNLSGHACRRNGGVVDFFSSQDTISVENCTHVMTQGSHYKFRSGYTVNRVIFNHNTWVNCSGYAFMNVGAISGVSVTNNIFVNTNVQAYCSYFQKADAGEVDPGDLPMGLVNVLDNADFVKNGGKFYVDKNLVYWDPTFSDVVSTLNTKKLNGYSNWADQKITMNTRSQGMFDNKDKYPYLVEGTWVKNKLPKFVDTKDLFTTQLTNLKAYVLQTVDTTSTAVLADWRLINTNASTDYTYSDWPIPINLAYTDTDLLTAGLGGFPLGDLNWLPTQNTAWTAQRTAELAKINTVLTTGVLTDVKQITGLPTTFKLDQNYPNPFNPSTVINFSLPKAGNVTLKVYNSIGQEVATLINGYKDAANYQVNFDASKLSSGVYFYSITSGNFTQTKKMMLTK